MLANAQFPTDLVIFTEHILNVKRHFFVQCYLFSQTPPWIYHWAEYDIRIFKQIKELFFGFSQVS